MNSNQYRSLESLREITWLTEQGVQEEQINPPMQSWLLEKGLLTKRLRSLCGAHFRLEVLHGPGADWDALTLANSSIATYEFKREVVMWCGEEPCIYAQTKVSESTANMHPWLRTLGAEPLGERLQSLADVTRSDFAFTCVGACDSDDYPVGRLSITGPLWARRSTFTIRSHELIVIEVFLPGLLACGNRSKEHR